MRASSCLPVLTVPADAIRLRDNEEWQMRFEIGSESSRRTYVIAQHRKGRYWGCSCPGWRTRRSCKHLVRFGLPADCQPYEVREAGAVAQVAAGTPEPVKGRFITWDDSDV